MSLPGQWQPHTDVAATTGNPPLENWWQDLDDRALSGLIRRAVAGNLDPIEVFRYE